MDISNQINSILDGTEQKEGYKLQGLIYQQKRAVKKENAKRRAEEERKKEWAKYGASTLEEYLKAKQQLCGAKMQEDTEEQTKKQEGNPQLEDGFIRIAQKLSKEFCKLKLSGQEWQIIWVILCKTYGFHKKDDWISLSQFSEFTGIDKSRICKIINKLIKKNIILKNSDGFKNTYSINKYYNTWVLSKKTIVKKDNCQKRQQPLSKKTIPIVQKDNNPLSKKTTTKDNITKDNITKDNITKDNITKDNSSSLKPKPKKQKQEEEITIPSWLDKELWNDFLEHRKALKKPMTPQAVKRAFHELEGFKNQGYDVEEIINTSIINGWLGLFEPKRRANKIPIREEQRFNRYGEQYKTVDDYDDEIHLFKDKEKEKMNKNELI